MTLEIWGLKTCDTCKKALRDLPGARLRDIRAEPLTAPEIAALLAAFGDKAINRASTTWRGLDDTQRAADPAQLLADHPALMKRPVIHAGGALHLGLSPATRAALAEGQ